MISIIDRIDRLFWIEWFLLWNGERESMAAILRGFGVGDVVVENVPTSSNMPMVFEDYKYNFIIYILYRKKLFIKNIF